MTYQMPKNISYTDMCIYIDTHVYTDNCDFDLVYQYLYHIFYMLARNARLFNDFKYYDGYAIFAANKAYFRLTNRSGIAKNHRKIQPVKSVLNYAKSILYPTKVDFEQLEYSQNLDIKTIEEFSENENIVITGRDSLHLVEFDAILGDIVSACKWFMRCSPYKTTSSEWLNIYTSVLLSILNEFTLLPKSKDRIKHLESTDRLKDSHIEKFFEDEREDSIILFHVDESLRDYITVLVRQIKHVIRTDLFTAIDEAYYRPERKI